jgi:hypothetical protein
MIGPGNSHFKDGRSYALWFDKMRPLIQERESIQAGMALPCCAACKIGETFKAKNWQGQVVMQSSIIIHHIDEDPSNNRADNLIALCRTCHAVHHKSATTPFPWFAAYVVQANKCMTSRWRAAATSLQATYSSTTVS